MRVESGIENLESRTGAMNVVLDCEKKLIRSVKELEVYKRAYGLSLMIHKSTLTFPKIEQYALADQLRRSSKSICANLAEGYAKQQQSKIEFRRFIANAIGSCNEVLTWLDYAIDLEYITLQSHSDWQTGYDSVLKMLIKLCNNIRIDNE